jgi:arylsulfatase A-like enzyme
MTIWSEGSLSAPDPKQKLAPPPSRHDLPLEEQTVAEFLKERGYLTALVGKWHLGDAAHFPETQGFDINIGGTHWGAPVSFFYPYRGQRANGEYRYVPHLEWGQPGEYLTDRLTDEALHIMRKAKDQPFFLMLSHHTVHTPIEGKREQVEYYSKKIRTGMKHRNAAYAAMVHSLDESVGRVLGEIDALGIGGRTAVVFASDNGGYINPYNGVQVTDNSPLRSGKGSLYEGGIRIPLMIRAPGISAPGGVCHTPVSTQDLFPTMLHFAGLKPPDSIPQDGVNLLPLLMNPGSGLRRGALYFHYPHYYPTTTPVSAIRAGEWKLLEYYEDGRLELYNLRIDPSEKRDLSRQMPERTKALRDQLRGWLKSVGAGLPSPNPAYKE